MHRTSRQPGNDMNRQLRHRWLKLLFWFWIGGSMLVGSYLVLAGPLTPFTGLDHKHVALAVVPFNILLLASGLGWLICLVRSRPRQRQQRH